MYTAFSIVFQSMSNVRRFCFELTGIFRYAFLATNILSIISALYEDTCNSFSVFSVLRKMFRYFVPVLIFPFLMPCFLVMLSSGS